MSKQYGILVDIATCIGCKVCMVACKQINNLDPSNTDIPGTQDWNHWITLLDIGPTGTYPNLQIYHLPINCQHCENPVCVEACPVWALDAGELDDLKGKYGALNEVAGFEYDGISKPSVIFKARKLELLNLPASSG